MPRPPGFGARVYTAAISWPCATSSSSVGTEKSGVPMKIRRRGILAKSYVHHSVVMAGLVPAIHVLAATEKEDVDARHKAGHDDQLCGYSPARLAALENFLFTRSRFSFDR